MFVYMIENKVTGKRYIGQTVSSLKKRWSHHCSPSSRCLALARAIKKYGRDNFSVKILSKAENKEQLNHREQYYIKIFKTLAPNGYNLMTGGAHSISIEWSNKKRAESNKKTREMNGPKIVSEETRKRISLANKGRKRSPEFCAKVSAGHKGKRKPEHTKKLVDEASIPVSQYTLDGVFVKTYPSATKASIDIGIVNGNISKCCKDGHDRQAGGFQWRFFEQPIIEKVRDKKINRSRKGKIPANSRKVAKIDENGNILSTYETAKLAAIENNCDHSSICKVCNGKLKSIKNLFFKFI